MDYPRDDFEISSDNDNGDLEAAKSSAEILSEDISNQNNWECGQRVQLI